MPNKSIILLQACGHNPTGADPTHEEWRELLSIVKVIMKLIHFYILN